jgi:hypothetical protein
MLEAEIVALCHQLNALRRKAPKRIVFSNLDRFIFESLYRLIPGILNSLVIVKPETVIRWHRAGFRLFWRWKSRSRGGRPKVSLEIRQLIRDCPLGHSQISYLISDVEVAFFSLQLKGCVMFQVLYRSAVNRISGS